MNPRLQQVIDHPLHQHLGIRDIHAGDGEASFSVEVGPNALNPAGSFHGGVLYLLCDVCAYAGLLSRLEDSTEAVTHDLQVSVLRPAKAGDRIDFRSRLLRLGRRLCFVDVEARVGNELIGSARVTKSILTPTG